MSDIGFAVARMKEGLAVRRASWPAGVHLSMVCPGTMLDVQTGDEIEALRFIAMRSNDQMQPMFMTATELLAFDWQVFTPETEGNA